MDLLIELPAVDIGHSWQEEYRTVPDSSVCFIFFPTTSIYSSLNSDWKQKKVCTKSLQSCPLFVTLWTVAVCVRVLVAQSCLTLWDPMDYSPPGSVHGILQKYWSGLPFPSPGDFPDPGIKPGSPALQADSLPAKPQGQPCAGELIQEEREV